MITSEAPADVYIGRGSHDNGARIQVREQPGYQAAQEISRKGDEIVLREKTGGMERAFEILTGLPEDVFPAKRKNAAPQKRKGL